MHNPITVLHRIFLPFSLEILNQMTSRTRYWYLAKSYFFKRLELASSSEKMEYTLYERNLKR